MRHLSDEVLARLVDEEPTEAEKEHLGSCERCAAVLRELRHQTEALASLPALRPPAGDWEELEARLVREGLVEAEDPAAMRGGSGSPAGRAGGGGSPFASSWLQAAAALVLFVGGTAFGTWVNPEGAEEAGAVAGSPVQETGVEAGAVAGVDEAARELQSAEERYVDALVTYRELLRETGASNGDEPENPAARVAALEALVAASQEAIRQAPADPFFNGVLASTMAERQAAIRQISSSSDDNWF